PGGEADRRGAMPVRHRLVARLEHGEGADQVVRGHRLAAEGRIGEDQRAALDILDCHFACGARREGFYVAPAPMHRRILRLRRDRRDALVAVPERMHVGPLERGDQRGIRPGSQLLSTEALPGPNDATNSSPPMIARFFMKWFIWLAYCAASNCQKRCAARAAISTKSASTQATQRVFHPMMRRIEPPSSMTMA